MGWELLRWLRAVLLPAPTEVMLEPMQKVLHLCEEQSGAIPTAGNNAAVLPF